MRNRRPLAAIAAACAVVLVAPHALGQNADSRALTLGADFMVTGSPIRGLCFSPDGALVASMGNAGDVTLIDCATGTVTHRLETVETEVLYPAAFRMQFSPDGRRIAVIHTSLSLWDSDTGQRVREPLSSAGHALSWSEDGRWLAWSLDAKTAGLLAIDTVVSADVRPVPLSTPMLPEALALSPDGHELAVADGKQVHVLLCESGEIVTSETFEDWTLGLEWSTNPGRTRIGQSGAHVLFGRATSIGNEVYSYSVQPDGNRVAIDHRDATHIVHRDGSGTSLPGRGIVALHPDGVRFARTAREFIELRGSVDGLIQRFNPCHRAKPRVSQLSGDGLAAVVRCTNAPQQAFELVGGHAIPIDCTRLPSQGLFAIHRGRPEFVIIGGRPDGEIDASYWTFHRDGGARLAHSAKLSELLRISNREGVDGAVRRIAGFEALSNQRRVVDLSVEDERDPWNSSTAIATASPDGRHFIETSTLMLDWRPCCRIHFLNENGAPVGNDLFSDPPTGIVFAKDSSKVFVTTKKSVQVYSTRTRARLKTISRRWVSLHRLDTGEFIAAEGSLLGKRRTTEVHDIILWDPDRSKVIDRVELGRRVTSMSLSGDGRRALVQHPDRMRVIEIGERR